MGIGGGAMAAIRFLVVLSSATWQVSNVNSRAQIVVKMFDIIWAQPMSLRVTTEVIHRRKMINCV